MKLKLILENENEEKKLIKGFLFEIVDFYKIRIYTEKTTSKLSHTPTPWNSVNPSCREPPSPL